MTPDDPAIPVAAYLRVTCADRQPGDRDRASQSAVIETFACAYRMRVHRWFVDDAAYDPAPGDRRANASNPLTALDALMSMANSPGRDFDFVLVLDPARLDRDHPGDWQARDAGLRAAGAPPLYVAEPGRNDARLLGARLKALYAEEFANDRRAALSRGIAAGHRRGALQGFHTGGMAPYGLRRQMIGWNQPGRAMDCGEGRPHGRYRSVLVHGPAWEVETVRRIFALYAHHGLTARAIARRLNAETATAQGARPDLIDNRPRTDDRTPRPVRWSRNRVLKLLENEIYLGVRRFGRRRTGGADPANLLRIEGVCQPVISRQLWEAAQSLRHARTRRFTDAEILEGLKRVLATHGVITRELVDRDPELPGWITVGKRFGSRAAAFAAIGYAAPVDWEARRAMGRARGAATGHDDGAIEFQPCKPLPRR